MDRKDSERVEMETDRLLTTEEAAEMLGLAPGTLRKLRSEGRSPVPFYKPFNGKTIRFRLSDVQEFIQKVPLRPEGAGVFAKPRPGRKAEAKRNSKKLKSFSI